MCPKTTNHLSSISVITEVYRFKVVNFSPFLACKILVMRPGAPKLGLRKAFISTHIAPKFQFCMSSGLDNLSELITYQAIICRFTFFVSQFTITLPRFPKIGTNDDFNSSYVEFKFQLFRLYRLLAFKQIIFNLPNSRTKTMVLRAQAEFQ